MNIWQKAIAWKFKEFLHVGQKLAKKNPIS